jgi:hypothetical protein
MLLILHIETPFTIPAHKLWPFAHIVTKKTWETLLLQHGGSSGVSECSIVASASVPRLCAQVYLFDVSMDTYRLYNFKILCKMLPDKGEHTLRECKGKWRGKSIKRSSDLSCYMDQSAGPQKWGTKGDCTWRKCECWHECVEWLGWIELGMNILGEVWK